MNWLNLITPTILIIGTLTIWLTGGNPFFFVGGYLAGMLSVTLWRLFVTKLAIWPVVTFCRSCNRRIWAWQKYHEVEYDTIVDSDDLPNDFVAFGLIHQHCSVPSIAFNFCLTKKVDSDNVDVHFDGLVLRPKEGLRGSVDMGAFVERTREGL